MELPHVFQNWDLDLKSVPLGLPAEVVDTHKMGNTLVDPSRMIPANYALKQRPAANRTES